MCRSVARVSAVRQNKLEKGWLAASFGYVAADGIINFVLCKLCSGPWPGGGEVTQLQAAVSMLYNLCVIRAAPGKCQNWWPLIFLRIALDRRLQPRRYSANSDPASCDFYWTIYHPHTTLSTTFLILVWCLSIRLWTPLGLFISMLRLPWVFKLLSCLYRTFVTAILARYV